MAHYIDYQRTDGSIQQRILPLLTPIWEDHELNDISYLKADTFSWQNGNVYKAVYQHLESDIFGKTLQKEHYSINVNKEGNPIIDNFVVNNFSGTNYLTLPQQFNTGNNTWEFVIKVKTGNTISSNESIVGDGVSSPYSGFYVILYNNKWSLGISTNGSSWNICEAQGTVGAVSANPNTEYYLKASWNGSVYKLEVSTDGETYQTSVSVNSTVAKYTKNNSIGNTSNLSGYQFNGSIDLKESYIKINDELWWEGTKNVNYYLANDGHKICPASEESNVDSLFNLVGVAKYFILDTDNNRFKVYREKYNRYSNELPVKGNGITLGFAQNGYNYGATLNSHNSNYTDIALSNTGYGQAVFSDAPYNNAGGYPAKTIGITTDSTKSGIIASSVSDSDMILYFYVGEFTQSAMANTAGLNAELFNNKLDNTIPHIIQCVETATGGYIVYSNGYYEEWGNVISGPVGTVTVNLSKQFKNTQYNISITFINAGSNPQLWTRAVTGKTVNSFTSNQYDNYFHDFSWKVCGFLAEGEY